MKNMFFTVCIIEEHGLQTKPWQTITMCTDVYSTEFMHMLFKYVNITQNILKIYMYISAKKMIPMYVSGN